MPRALPSFPGVRPRRRAAFTLTELLVAIGIVSVLTIAIGQIFRAISRIVSVGTAIAECDQLARTIERQMRDDFEAFRQLAPEETFIAIRMREIGDVNRNGVLDSDERAVYLTREDRDADILDGLNPYQVDTARNLTSRAVTRRLDDVVFLAFGGQGGYDTSQLDHLKDTTSNNVRRVPAFSAPHARLYWGHALRPAPDPLWPPADPSLPSSPRVPNKQFIPDGDFASRAGDMNRFNPTPSVPVSPQARNEVAGEWMLARQQTLLTGAESIGQPGAARPVAAIGNGREWAPYIRDLESRARFRGQSADFAPRLVDGGVPTDSFVQDDLYNRNYPEPRLLGWGRVDICAQSREDVQRWLEGEDPNWQNGSPAARPYSSGGLADPRETDNGAQNDDVNRFLWQRFADGAPNTAGGSAANLAANLQGLRQAIAGVFFRPLSESVPPPIDRDPIGAGAARVQPEDALMDTHAVIAQRCSNFEIAWTDRSIALRDIDVNSDDVPEALAGDLLWFDITPVQTGASPSSFVRSTLTSWAAGIVNINGAQPMPRVTRADYVQFIRYAPTSTDPANPLAPFPSDFPEVLPVARFESASIDSWRRNREGLQSGGPGDESGVYNPDVSGGAPLDAERLFPSDDQGEYFAIWPFRRIDATGAYSAPVSKDILIRVRMTLHDSQMRLKEGRTYEFIFDLGRQVR